jgi:hypothetical protein
VFGTLVGTMVTEATSLCAEPGFMLHQIAHWKVVTIQRTCAWQHVEVKLKLVNLILVDLIA